jgi:hypothetical protein
LTYLRNRRLWQLAIVQGLSVLLIGFRMSYLLVVQGCTILLPVIAFAHCALRVLRHRSGTRTPEARVLIIGSIHVIASIAMMFVMHGAYKYANGRLSHREPAYLYNTGDHLAAVWAPALKPSDATDPRFGEIIANGDQIKIKDLHFRNAQQYAEGLLIPRWHQIEKNRRENDRVSRETSINALRHRPLEIVGLAVQTYLEYWNLRLIWRYARNDLGYGKLKQEQLKTLDEKFGFQTVNYLPVLPYSLLQRYFLAAWPYYFIVVLSPLICAFAVCFGRHRAFAFLLFTHASILMVVVTALSPQASIRYVQPISLLTLLGIALCIDWLATRKGRRRCSPPLGSASLKEAI